MNKDRRKRLTSICGTLAGLHKRFEDATKDFKDEITTVAGAVQDLQAEEQDAFDNLPENQQQGERGEGMQEGLDKLQEAVEKLEAAADEIDECL